MTPYSEIALHSISIFVAQSCDCGSDAEYQNEPKVEDLGDEMFTAEAIASKTNGFR